MRTKKFGQPALLKYDNNRCVSLVGIKVSLHTLCKTLPEGALDHRLPEMEMCYKKIKNYY